LRRKFVPRWRKRRYSAISRQTRTLVFTDLDGTLLDHDTYSWAAAAPALEELQRREIPLIFCTSKTDAEVQALRRAMGNSHPFIVENGGAIVIPPGFFRPVPPFRRNSRALTLVLGRPYNELLRDLKRIAQESHLGIRGFHQMSDAEVARETGLSLPDAQRARQRKTSEPFLFRKGSPGAFRRFRRRAKQHGYSVERGGRFFHFSGGCDKGLALSIVLGFYGLTWRTRVNTIALGDSGNDLSMLRLVDCPILIPKPDGRFSREVLEALPNIVQAKRPGPAGWSSSLLRELQRNSQGTASPPSARYYLEMTEVGKTGAVSEQKH
jgi:mannosyl-3-phosphoglycerate phosphatase